MYFRFIANPIVDMQIIDTRRKIGNIKLHCAAFGCGLAKQDALPAEETKVVGYIFFLNIIIRYGCFIDNILGNNFDNFLKKQLA